MRRALGHWLAAAKDFPRGGLVFLAFLLEVTVRAVAGWRSDATESGMPVRGRPPHPPAIRRRVFCRVARVVLRDGSRATCRSTASDPLLEGQPRVLVNRFVGDVKRRREMRHQQRIEAQRQHVLVHAKDVIWALDGTHLAREQGGTPVVAETVREVGTREILEGAVGPPKTGQDVIAAIEKLAQERDGFPLVAQSDGGPENVNEKVMTFLAGHKIVHLRNAPGTPQHNPHAERANGELKRAMGLFDQPDLPWEPLPDRKTWQHRADDARDYLNDVLIRPVLSHRTAADYARTLPPWYTRVSRDVFYAETQRRIQAAVRGIEDNRERILAERRAIFESLAHFGLVTLTRGDTSRLPLEQEEIS